MTTTLTETQHQFLADFYLCGTDEGEWVRPMDIGGRNGSNHSALLSQLERHGFVESRVRSTGVRGSKLYRLTASGRSLGAGIAKARRT
ncbi:hypothetical protein [Mycobacteroides chelonae]|uniref:hypothetical protein n=1 Tax=Mycobacteroides chelonae TaxID=1774 RepID=UPI0010427FC8|nr:hypothetical protein [Mycobacteroides chelonae]